MSDMKNLNVIFMLSTTLGCNYLAIIYDAEQWLFPEATNYVKFDFE